MQLHGPAVSLWQKHVTTYETLIEQAIVGIFRGDRRDSSSYLTKLLKDPKFKKFCAELHGKLYDAIQRYVAGESPMILEREMFGSSDIVNQTDINSPASHRVLSKFYAQYVSATLLDHDPFKADEQDFRESIKAATDLSASHRFIDRPALQDALNSVEADSALIYKTKFKNLNHFLGGGVRTRRLYTVGGAPGVGKSGFLLNQFLDACMNGVPSVYISLENSFEETQRRLIAHLAKYDLSMLYFDRPGVREDLMARLEDYKDVIEKVNKYGTIIETSSTTLDELRGIIQEKKPKMLVLDYLNLVTHIVYRDRPKDLEDLTMCLARLSKEFHIALWTACQLNRAAIQAKDPDESNVGDSFGIVKATDIFFTLYPYKGDEKDEMPADVLEQAGGDLKEMRMVLRIAKSRFTALGRISLLAKKKLVDFQEL